MSSSSILEEDPLEFEEWDGKSPFWHHCLAGSLAGVAEHVLVYPLDTVKTHIQCATCPVNPSGNPATTSATSSVTTAAARSLNSTASSLKHAAPVNSGLFTTMRHIVSQPTLAATSSDGTVVGYSRLWRGVQTVMVGCIPAHALYFSSYEFVKYSTTRPDGSLPYWAGLLAGAAAVLGHDVIMSPLDTIKQRLQLGHYTGMRQAALHMMKHEGAFSLYRSFPVTLLTNIPYGSIMVSTNEVCKAYMTPEGSHAPPSLAVCLISSSMGGLLASFVTTPFDRIKTALQVQALQPAYCERYGSCPKISPKAERVEIRQAIRQIVQKEGVKGLFKGSLPRILSHTPAVAISWTTYETAKQWLAHL
jgi:solute carrier family 25 iron transporter 28/37